MADKPLLIGVIGSALVALCCVTPLLPITLSALGLAGLTGLVYSDAVLLPVLTGFLSLTGYALWRRRKA